jgi:hypothetical protein
MVPSPKLKKNSDDQHAAQSSVNRSAHFLQDMQIFFKKEDVIIKEQNEELIRILACQAVARYLVLPLI